MAFDPPMTKHLARRIRWPVLLTRVGMIAEAVVRAFWPLWSVVFVALGLLMLGVQDHLAASWIWGAGAGLALAVLASLFFGIRKMRWPGRQAALDRLDATLPGRPIQTSMDTQIVGAKDVASQAVWHAHQARMTQRLEAARPVVPDLRVAGRDPFALRYVAVLVLCVGALFGSVLRVQSVTSMGVGDGLVAGPTWEGWMEPPTYTRLPAVYLKDVTQNVLKSPVGSRVTVRLYGEVGALAVRETVSAQPALPDDAPLSAMEFDVVQSGRVAIEGPGGQEWLVSMLPDIPPSVDITGDWEASFEGEASLPFQAQDDYAVDSGLATINLALVDVDRRFGLAVDPEPRDAVIVPLPMPISGSRAEFSEAMIEDFSKHPWALLPVRVTLQVEDALGQIGTTSERVLTLPGRRFFDPLAASVIELRRDLLWNRENGKRVSQVMRAVSYLPDDLFRAPGAYLRFRTILRRLEASVETGLTAPMRDDLAAAMWDLAVILEEGDLSSALERLRRAQDRLSEAMRNGASDQEIAELMQELRQATEDYMRQLSRQAQQQPQDGDPSQGQDSESLQMTQNDLQQMMDRIQELMEQGRMAEAQQALDELRQMMENMRVTQNPNQNGQSQGQQAMEGLAETLRDQQGLSDQAFRDLQEQFNPGANQGESQQNEGRSGGQGRGQQHDGQGGRDGQGEQGEQGEQGQEGQADTAQGQSLSDSLADRQQALRNQLGRQRQNLPGAGSEAGDAARDALGRAETAMDGAEDALRQGDLAEAIDRQAEAMEAMRDGMRSLGEAMAEQQGQQGEQGAAEGDQAGSQRDPLGRNSGNNGEASTRDDLLQGEDVYRRARDLLDEIRRRSGDGERPEVELEYLRRLLERF
ncbi:MAG: TIGR02302 family protein [Rhodobacteraceae bacterium]|nr:TIGR02302 family protein [Paracoccaceae bacterium]